MTKEEFHSTYEKAKRQYLETMDLMGKDAPFMENLPKQVETIIGKIKSLTKDTAASKTGAEMLDKVNILKEVIIRFVELDKDVLAFWDETVEDWKELNAHLLKYNEHSHPGENLPKTKEGATEWVIQLEETSAAMLQIYEKFHPQINQFRQRYNKLLMEAQPYLN